MSGADNNYVFEDLYGTMIRVENKDIFVDLKQNGSGVYLKLSERNGKSRNTVLIPASGIGRLVTVLEEVAQINFKSNRVSTERKNRIAGDPEVVSRSVYTSGLAWSTGEESLIAHFSQAGAVRNAVVLRKTRRGKTTSMGCGVVEFETPEEAQNAVHSLNETELDGRIIKCREDRFIEEGEDNIYEAVQNDFVPAAPVVLPIQVVQGISDGDEVVAAKPKRVRKPRSARGNATQMEAEPLPPISTSAPAVPLSVASTPLSPSGPPAMVAGADNRHDPYRVFVTSLAWETTKEDLAEFFSKVGEVVATEVLTTKKGRSLGHGIVQFVNPTSAAEAVERLHKQELDGRVITVREYFEK